MEAVAHEATRKASGRVMVLSSKGRTLPLSSAFLDDHSQKSSTQTIKVLEKSCLQSTKVLGTVDFW